MTSRGGVLKRLTASLLTGLVVGLGLGAACPQHAQASFSWQFWWKVPAGATDSQVVTMTCGWHVECTYPYSKGPALDWDAPGGGVYLRGAGYVNSSGVLNGTYARIVNWPRWVGSECRYIAVARFYNVYSGGAWLTDIAYKHTTTGGPGDNTYVNQYYSDPAYGNPGVRIAGVIPPPWETGCTFDLPHIHVQKEGEVYQSTPGSNWWGFPDAPLPGSYNNLTWLHWKSWWTSCC